MYGSTMNWSLTENDGQYELGLSYNDSSGIDIDHTIQSDNFSSLVNDTIKVFKKEYAQQTKRIAEEIKKQLNNTPEKNEKKNEKDDYTIKLEKIIQDLKKENASLKLNNEVLQRRAEDMMNNFTIKSNSKEKIASKEPSIEDLLKIFF